MLNTFLSGNGTQRDNGKSGILNTAYTAFAEDGFSKVTLSDIAEKSGMSLNNLTSLFQNKDVLYKELVIDLIDIDKITKGCDDILEKLVVLIEELEGLITDDYTRAKFFECYLYDSSVPADIKSGVRDKLKKTDFIHSFSKAQEEGKILKGETVDLFIMFTKVIFKMMMGFKEAGVAFPDNEWFLNVIYYPENLKAPENSDATRRMSAIIEAFLGEYNSIIFADLDTGSMDVYQAVGENDNWIGSMARRGYDEYRENVCDKFIFPEDREWFLKETDRKNVLSKLEKDPVLYIDHRIIKHGMPVSYQTVIVIDPTASRGNKVIIGGTRTYDKTIDAAYTQMVKEEKYPKTVVG